MTSRYPQRIPTFAEASKALALIALSKAHTCADCYWGECEVTMRRDAASGTVSAFKSQTPVNPIEHYGMEVCL